MKRKPYNKLKLAFMENDIKYEDIAILLSLTTNSVSNKINGISDFYISEVVAIQERYGKEIIETDFFS